MNACRLWLDRNVKYANLCQFKNSLVCEHRQISGFCFSPPMFFGRNKSWEISIFVHRLRICLLWNKMAKQLSNNAEFLLHSSNFHFVQLNFAVTSYGDGDRVTGKLTKPNLKIVKLYNIKWINKKVQTIQTSIYL